VHVVVEHRFKGVSVDRFAEVYFSRDYNDAVAPLAHLERRELVSERTREDGHIERRVRMVPSVNLPWAVKQLLRGAPVEYFEVSTYDPEHRVARYRVESGAGDLIKVWGTIHFLPDGEGCKRRIEGDVEVGIPGLGRVIEKLIADELNKRYDRIQAFTQRYLEENA
jgi:hypothetical protein